MKVVARLLIALVGKLIFSGLLFGEGLSKSSEYKLSLREQVYEGLYPLIVHSAPMLLLRFIEVIRFVQYRSSCCFI